MGHRQCLYTMLNTAFEMRVCACEFPFNTHSSCRFGYYPENRFPIFMQPQPHG